MSGIQSLKVTQSQQTAHQLDTKWSMSFRDTVVAQCNDNIKPVNPLNGQTAGLVNIYRVIHKSLRDFRSQRYSIRDGHAEGELVNRGRDTQSFCPTLQVLDTSTLGDAADVNPVIKFQPHRVNHVA
jgi:hypothetical protein